ncbi:MAG: fuculose phosphate aldolase [Thermoplasmata archaeon]|nr:MAG: fuculose phosphate aldolase [Thermoplasmata archaeon]
MSDVWEEFARIGGFMEKRGLILSSHSGNMSIRADDYIYITRRDSMLGSLSKTDVVKVHLHRDDENAALASRELVVHREIYNNTDALAIIHTHTPYATVLSMIYDEILPLDEEGRYIVGRIPVIVVERSIGSEVAAKKLGLVLKDAKCAVIRSHGIFAKGNSLEDAYRTVSSAEASCRIMYLHMIAQQVRGDGNIP